MKIYKKLEKGVETMKERHLRLVYSHDEEDKKTDFSVNFFEKMKDFFDCITLSKHEKIYIIKDVLIKIYRDYEKTTGIIDIPYFVRAEHRISQIIKDRKINYYYIRLKSFKHRSFL